MGVDGGVAEGAARPEMVGSKEAAGVLGCGAAWLVEGEEGAPRVVEGLRLGEETGEAAGPDPLGYS